MTPSVILGFAIIILFCLFTLWIIKKTFIDDDETYRALVPLVVFMALALVLVGFEEYEKTAPPNTDPIYNANLNGSAPQIVRQYQEGDDIRPNLHTVYYYPELDQYQVVVIMGKDR